MATVTEVADYLRVLFARVGTPHCPRCGRELHAQSAEEITQQVSDLPEGTRFQVLAPVTRQRKGTFKDVFEQARIDGFNRVRADDAVYDLAEEISLDKNKKHNIDLVVDRLTALEKGNKDYRDYLTRLTDSIETALRVGDGLVVIDRADGEDWLLSENLACPDCGISFPPMEPTMFSFNSPMGMCPECNGLGELFEFDMDLIIDPSLSVGDGAVRSWERCARKRKLINMTLSCRFWVHLGLIWILPGWRFLKKAAMPYCKVVLMSRTAGRPIAFRGIRLHNGGCAQGIEKALSSDHF